MDTQAQIKALQQQVNQIQAVLNQLRNSATIPHDIGGAFSDRVGSGIIFGKPSSSTAAMSVNEAGVATYSVAKLMDGLIPANVKGLQCYLPFYL